MQALFYMDIHQKSSQELLERFCEYFSPPEKTRPFFFKLVNGVLATRTEIDALIDILIASAPPPGGPPANSPQRTRDITKAA